MARLFGSRTTHLFWWRWWSLSHNLPFWCILAPLRSRAWIQNKLIFFLNLSHWVFTDLLNCFFCNQSLLLLQIFCLLTSFLCIFSFQFWRFFLWYRHGFRFLWSIYWLPDCWLLYGRVLSCLLGYQSFKLSHPNVSFFLSRAIEHFSDLTSRYQISYHKLKHDPFWVRQYRYLTQRGKRDS